MTFEELARRIKVGDVASIQLALEGGVSSDLANPRSWTLLMVAALSGNRRIGQLLISRGATVDLENDFGETALSLAAHQGHLRFVELLLSAGANPAFCHPHGHTLDEWVRGTSGLSSKSVDKILSTIRRSRLN